MAEKWVIIQITKQENSLNEVSISYLLLRICTLNKWKLNLLAYF